MPRHAHLLRALGQLLEMEDLFFQARARAHSVGPLSFEDELIVDSVGSCLAATFIYAGDALGGWEMSPRQVEDYGRIEHRIERMRCGMCHVVDRSSYERL